MLGWRVPPYNAGRRAKPRRLKWDFASGLSANVARLVLDGVHHELDPVAQDDRLDLDQRPIAAVFQSGLLTYSLIEPCIDRNIGFTYVVTTGNEADLDLADFVREKAEIAWGRGKAKVVIEAALDLGKVIAGEGEEEICELELELRQGEPAALLELACELAAELPLMPCDISKAERGYRLFDSGSYSLSLPPPQLTADMALDDADGWAG